jgi:hypothetical protein
VVALNRNILRLFHIVDTLQNCQSMTDTSDSHALQVVVLQGNQGFANDFVF